MEYQKDRVRMNQISTWAILKDGQLGGYFEAYCPEPPDDADGNIEPELVFIARAVTVFEREMFKSYWVIPAINLCLSELFNNGIEVVYFPVFEHNNAMQDFLAKLGATRLSAMSPAIQEGQEVKRVLWAVGAADWEKRNAEFIAEQFKKEALANLEVAV
jgi:hypothetical protein